jgi:uncharacterized protein YggL (DUF469 family)
MTIDEFQDRLREIFDGTLARLVQAKEAHDEATNLLFDEVETFGELTVEACGGVLNAEVLRFDKLVAKAGMDRV